MFWQAAPANNPRRELTHGARFKTPFGRGLPANVLGSRLLNTFGARCTRCPLDLWRSDRHGRKRLPSRRIPRTTHDVNSPAGPVLRRLGCGHTSRRSRGRLLNGLSALGTHRLLN